MKRSEMVKILQNSILNHMNCQYCCKGDEDMYSTILKEIEDTGMLPPLSDTKESTAEIWPETIKAHKWEKE